MAQPNFKSYSQDGLSFLGRMQRPIPGQSLTDSPDRQYPWEQPPEHVELQPAMEAIFMDLSEPEVYASITDMAANGTPVSDIAQIILYGGFEQGLWNPDLMLLLIEPTMYMIMGLIEKAGVLEYQIYRGEEEDASDEEEQVQALDGMIDQLKEKVVPIKTEKDLQGVLPPQITERLKTLEVSQGLLSRTKTENTNTSLLEQEEK